MPLPFYFTNDRNFPPVIVGTCAYKRNPSYIIYPLSNLTYRDRIVSRMKFRDINIIEVLLLLQTVLINTLLQVDPFKIHPNC